MDAKTVRIITDKDANILLACNGQAKLSVPTSEEIPYHYPQFQVFDKGDGYWYIARKAVFLTSEYCERLLDNKNQVETDFPVQTKLGGKSISPPQVPKGFFVIDPLPTCKSIRNWVLCRENKELYAQEFPVMDCLDALFDSDEEWPVFVSEKLAVDEEGNPCPVPRMDYKFSRSLRIYDNGPANQYPRYWSACKCESIERTKIIDAGVLG